MAQINYDDGYYADDGARNGGSVSAVLNWAGALLSLALIAGLAVWGWQLTMRDVSGVPVVRALEGPMRVAPEDPGGVQAANQGLAVNRIPAEGEAAVTADRVVLAPRPLRLTEEDQPAAELSVTPLEDVETVAATATTPAALAGAPAGETVAAEPASATDLAVAEALAAIAEGEIEVTPAKIVKPGDEDGLARSLRPTPRPAGLSDIEATSAPASPLAAGEVDAATIPVGTRLVQLGAFASPEIARAEWQALDQRFGAYLAGKTRVIQQAEAGGKTFYRLRAMGFEDLSDARRFCSVLVADQAGCIPVIRR